MGKSYTLKAETGFLRISSFGLHKYANEFFEASELYEKLIQNRKGFSLVPYYLYCHSIELMLKAILLHCEENITQKQLKEKYGHNLIKTLKAIEKLFKSKLLNDNERKTLKKANNYYYKKGFEYFKVIDAVHGYRDLPDLFQLKEIAQKLLKHPISKSFKT